ncbi:hypothetical protein ACFLVG_00400 [Chloroflexota bacterium]
MVKGDIVALDHLLDNAEVDKIGAVRLDDWKDTPLWDKARQLLPEPKSIIVLALEVLPEVIKYLTSQAQVGEIVLRDLFTRNVELVNGHLDWQAYKTVKKLHSLGFKGVPLPAGGAPFDNRFLEGTLSYKHAARAAGIGVLGWHSMLITPEYGTRVRLACVITDALLLPSAPVVEEAPCPECGGACIKICPASAITKPQGNETYKINSFACNTYLNASGSCSECLKVCPAGRQNSR